MPRIHLSVPHLGSLEQEHVLGAFASNWVSTVGPNLERFEEDFSGRMGGLPCVALASGTAALHLALRALGVGPGDDVVVPTLTFVATVNPVVYLGARPVFVDSERRTWNLDPSRLSDLLAARARAGRLPRAVVPVHLYGTSAELTPILEVCAQYGVPVVEDAAEALGTLYQGRQVGTFGAASIFSFNGNKIITTSGGGMLVARDPKVIEKARYWSQQAREPGLAYQHVELGYNYRMSNVLAGIGRGQLSVLDARVNARRDVFARYRAAFADIASLEPMPEPAGQRLTHWLSCFLLPDSEARDRVISALAHEDVESRPVWKPMHLQPLFESADCVGGEVARDLFERGVCLPSSSSLSEAEQMKVVATVRGALGAKAVA